MKKNLQLVAFTLMAMFLFTNLGYAQLQMQKADHQATLPIDKNDDGDWWHYDTGESTNSIGLGGEDVEWIGAIKFPVSALEGYDGYEITRVRAFFPQMPTAAGAIIFQGEEDALEEVGFQMYSSVTVEEWNELEFFDPVVIDASRDLWIGIWMEEPGDDVFPLGVDGNVDNDGLGNLASWDTDGPWVEWNLLSAFGIDGVWNIQGFVVPGENGNGNGDEIQLTFMVDMGPAVAEGFDPAEHHVFVTGSFAGWAEPGTEGSVQLALHSDAKDDELEYIWPGNWANRTGEEMGSWSEGGYILGTNVYEDGAYGQIFNVEGEHHIAGGKFWLGSVIGAAGNALFTIWDYSGGQVGDVIHAHSVPMADLIESNSFDDAFVVHFDEPVHIDGAFVMGVDLSQLEDYVEDVYELGNFHSAGGDGDGGGLAIVLEGTSWVPVLNYGVDVDAAIFPFLATDDNGDDPDPVDELWYSATVMLEEAGEVQYKYFSDAFGAGWEGGEWEGDPNRVINVTADMTVMDEWAVQPGTSVENVLAEQGLNMFPNPVRNTLYVENASQINEIRIFDLTGRLIMAEAVNNNTVAVNVSQFKQGVYVMQVIAVDGMSSQRFVVR